MVERLEGFKYLGIFCQIDWVCVIFLQQTSWGFGASCGHVYRVLRSDWPRTHQKP